MASTQNRNMHTEYTLEQKQNKQIVDDRTSELRQTAYNTALPCVGVNVGAMPKSVLSFNSTNIESNLYGIGSTNLVSKRKEFTPRIKKLPTVAFFKRPDLLIPEPLVIQRNQRPKIL